MPEGRRDVDIAFYEEMDSDVPRLDVLEDLRRRGADVNYRDEDDWPYLASAVLGHNVECVRWLLAAGANPNTIVDPSTTVLNLAEGDRAYHQIDYWGENQGDEIQNLDEIIELLLASGAKAFSDIYADRLEKWLSVSALGVTGLSTRGGNLNINQLPGTTESFVLAFEQWRASHWDVFPRDGCLPPPEFDRVEHNRIGVALYEQIKAMVGPEVHVTLLCIDPDLECIRVRSVMQIDERWLETRRTHGGP